MAAGEFNIHEIAPSQYYESPVKIRRNKSKILKREMLNEYENSTLNESPDNRSSGSMLKKRSKAQKKETSIERYLKKNCLDESENIGLMN